MGGIIILESQKGHFIRVGENMLLHPNSYLSICWIEFYINKMCGEGGMTFEIVIGREKVGGRRVVIFAKSETKREGQILST